MVFRLNLLSLLDSQLPDVLRTHGDTTHLLRARVVMGLLLMYGVSTALMVVMLSVLNMLGLLDLWSMVPGSFISTLLFGYTYYYLRKTANLYLAAHMLLGASFLATVGFTYITGALDSPVIMIFLCTSINAFLMGGRPAGVIWSAIAAIVYAAYYVLDGMGVTGYRFVAASQQELLEVLCWVYAWADILICMALYSSLARRLSDNLNAEREQLRIKATYDGLTGAYTRQYFTDHLRQCLRTCHEPGRSFLFLDLDILPQALLSRDDEEHMLKQAVQAIQNRYPGRVEPARSGGLSLLAVLHDVPDVDRAEEYTAAIYMSLRDAVDESLARIQIGAVMVPTYADTEKEVLVGARKASLEAVRDDQPFVLYTDAQRVRVEKWTPRNWVTRRYSEMVGA